MLLAVAGDLGLELMAVTLDCDDVDLVARFWSELIGQPLRESLPGWRRLDLPPNGTMLTFQPVGRKPADRPPAHIDLATTDGKAAVSRVIELGGSAIEEHHYDEGVVRVVADPEGHTFCLVEYRPGHSPA
jgi:predicted enzyme related to lactoylglutathione lyase